MAKAIEKAKNKTRVEVLGFPIDICDDIQFSAIQLHSQGGGQVVTINAEMIMAAKADKKLAAAISASELVIPDGVGIVWALRLQGMGVPRSPGIELAKSLLVFAEENSWKVALVGASPEVMLRLREKLKKELPSLRLEMTIHGYQTKNAWRALESDLKQLRPDLVLVALGIPKQETWSMRLRESMPGLWIGVGGSFDIWAGVKKRAPKWLTSLHLEWMYRLVKEPSRWRRMLSLPAFAWEVLRPNRKN